MKKTIIAGKTLQKWFIAAIFLLFIHNSVLAQQTITGTVTDAKDGLPIPGVNVIIKGTSKGTITDLSGNYSLSVTQDTKILVFSYIGYNKQEVTIGDKTTIDVVLSEDVTGLEEVVVVGYGTMKKKDLTGSVSIVKPEDVSGMPVQRSDLLLQGRTSGVEVTRNSGAPGGSVRVRIRGVHSVNADNEPLVVVDGFPGGSLEDINPNDIERIDVLKDASALAIYGARATNGVILVTTKSGKKGSGKIEFNYSKSFQQITDKIEVLGSQDYGYFYNEAYQNDGDPRPYPVIGSRKFPTRPEDIDWNVDWHDLVYRPGQIDEYQLAISGGSEKIMYYISGNYFDQQGIIPNSDFKRYAARINLKAKTTDWFETGLNLGVSRRIFNGETGFWSGTGVSNKVLGYSPLYEPKDTLGNWDYNRLDIVSDNPLATVEIPVPVSELKYDHINPEIFGLFTISQSLTFKLTAGFQTTYRRHGQAYLQESFTGKYILSETGNAGQARANNDQNMRFVNENVLTYDKQFTEKHHLMAMLGYSREIYQAENYSAVGKGFISDAFMFEYNNLDAADSPTSISSEKTRTEMESYFSRIHYDLTNRYSVTLNGRIDGSSVFAKNQKYAFFPSAALAWKVHNENFMTDLQDIINELKIRVSYGIVGNQAIKPYQSLAILGTSQIVMNNNIKGTGVVPYSVENKELTWESTSQFNIGLDMSFLSDRIRFTADYYKKHTYDLLFSKQFPYSSGFMFGTMNIGEVENKGVEFSIHSYNLQGAFAWETDFNISMNRNEILKLTGEEMMFVSNATLETALSLPLNILQVGEPISTFYGLAYEGVYATEEAANAEGGKIGQANYKDANGDGEFNAADDRIIIGSAFPDFIWGMNNTFRYKGIELGVFIQASHGADLYNLTRQRIESMHPGTNQSLEAYNNRTRYNKETETWTITDIPMASSYNKTRPTDRFIEDGSFIRVKNIMLGYALPQKIVNKVRIKKAKFYLSAQNPFIWTNYKGYDPEVSRYKNSDVALGIDDGTYPNVKSFTLGVQLGF